jgi:hypothetical protein
MTIPNHYIWLWKDKTILYMVKYVTDARSNSHHFLTASSPPVSG